MSIAIKEAMRAKNKEEIPVGVVIVKDNKVIAKAHNTKEKNNDPTKHAEIIAIQKACKKIGDWRLNECLLFVTLEPCVMCIGAIAESRIKKVICGIKNKKYHIDVKNISKRNAIDIKYGVLQDESLQLIKDFFINQRKK